MSELGAQELWSIILDNLDDVVSRKKEGNLPKTMKTMKKKLLDMLSCKVQMNFAFRHKETNVLYVKRGASVIEVNNYPLHKFTRAWEWAYVTVRAKFTGSYYM